MEGRRTEIAYCVKSQEVIDSPERPDFGWNIAKFCAKANELIRESAAPNYAILSFNVKHFLLVNELFGFQNGNRVILQIHRVLNNSLHDGELCAHLGGDRFLLLLRYETKRELEKRAEHIGHSLSHSILFYGTHYKLEYRMGLYAIDSNSTLSIEAMMDRAILAQKSIPDASQKFISFYEDRMRLHQLAKKNMKDRLLPALKNQEFVIYYQPKYDLNTQKMIGSEALVRWKTEPGVLIPPGEFIPDFEANGVIVPLDRYIFEQVCADIRHWMELGMKVVPVSVNLSRAHLYRPMLKTDYERIARRYGVPFPLLELELTESALAANPKKIPKVMNRLRRAGFPLSIDDFGAGYSSLNMLTDIPAGTVKLDRGFMNHSVNSEKNQALLRNIIRLCKEMGFTVVAEGVETKAQVQLLKALQCDMAQGFYFSRPLPKNDYEQILAAQ